MRQTSQDSPEPPVYLNEKAIENLKRIGGNDLVRNMMNIFLDETHRRVEDTFMSYETGDYKLLENLAHSIKSTAGNLGLDVLYRFCSVLEQKAREKRGVDTALVSEFQLIFSNTKSAVEQYLAGLESSESSI
jgi:HPt (histidine-containing phosphotransfer) domain-containing protein